MSVCDRADDHEQNNEDSDEDDNFTNLSHYSGGILDGLYHGRGTLHMLERLDDELNDNLNSCNDDNIDEFANTVVAAVFEGRFRNGLRNGRGMMTFPDGSHLRGVWVNDELEGKGVYHDNVNNTRLEGEYLHGQLHGVAILYDLDIDASWNKNRRKNDLDRVPCGLYHNPIISACNYKQNMRNGFGFSFQADGGCLVGNWVDDQFEGSDNAYFYALPYPSIMNNISSASNQNTAPHSPLITPGLRGEWRENQMQNAGFVIFPWLSVDELISLVFEFGTACHQEKSMIAAIMNHPLNSSPNVREIEVKRQILLDNLQTDRIETMGISDDTKMRRYQYDPPTYASPSLTPLIPDPWEQMLVTVRQSTIPNAQEGLFALVDLPAGIVVSHYGGILIDQNVVDERDWALNDNTIALDEEERICLDVPGEYIKIDNYCATLGHKANHTSRIARLNAKYDHIVHPRFGHIKCIRSIVPIRAGEEILVDYGYDHTLHEGGPSWYRKLHE